MNIYLLIYGVGLPLFLILAFTYYFIFKRNYFNKHKYMRIEEFKSDKSVSVSYIKREHFNKNNQLLINPNHVFNFKGYTTIAKTDKTAETINPLDFESKYDSNKFKTAINSKLIHETFATLQKPKIDYLMISVILNGLTLLAIIYLILKLGGNL